MRSAVILLSFPFLALSLVPGTVVRAGEPAAEPKGPQATAAVRATLEESGRLLGERKAEEALVASERALDEAGKTDVAGQAYAQRDRGRALGALGRHDEALAAWRQAAGLWEQLGAGPERIEALCAQASLLGRDDPPAAAALVDLAASLASRERTRPLAAASILNTASESSWGTGQLDTAQRLAAAALAIHEKHAPGSLGLAMSLNLLGNVSYRQGDLDAALDLFQRALAIREKLAPESLAVAGSLNNLGSVASARGDLDAAWDYQTRALAIKESLAPGSLDVAKSLNNLGTVALSRGDLDTAWAYLQRSLAIIEKVAPGSIDLGRSLGNIGVLALSRGDLDGASDYLQRALAIKERVAPGSLDLAATFESLGNVARSRGDLDAALDLFRRALAIREKQAPGSLTVAGNLENIGLVAYARGDMDAAWDYLQRGLAIEEKLAPGSLDVAASLSNLGMVASHRDDLDAALDHFQRALAIREKLAPGSLDVSVSLDNLGHAALARDDLEAARDFYQRSLDLTEKAAPGSLEVAMGLNNLGVVASRREDLQGARDYYVRALEIQEKLAPASLDLAETLNAIGQVARSSGDLAAAEDYLARSWAIVRGQRQGVVGEEAGRAYSAATADHAAELARVRFARGRKESAFEALEEGRAQVLLRLASERSRGWSEVDPGLWRRYEEAERALRKAGTELASAAQREPALSAYTQARLEQERLLGEVRRSVPGLQPRSFSFEEARRALPAGSVFVAWLVGKEESLVFVIPADPKRSVEAETIPLGEVQLAGQVDALLERIDAGRWLRGAGGPAKSSKPPADPELVSASHALFGALFPPRARAALLAARRVILSPDGPLWDLPFAALATRASEKPGWLGLGKPLSYSPSLTLLALERERDDPPAGEDRGALVVGDPVFVRTNATVDPGSPLIRSGGRAALVSGSSPPTRLPASAGEAQRTAALYDTEPLLGEAATEKAVRQRISSAAVVHFATHGYFHPSLAMSSGLLLTPPAVEDAATATDDDGALQAWELGRTLPLSAQLVVLSACETGRGEKVRGEGLVGLTWAFQGAGARSVVATHWKVADESTAGLMVSFHEKLRGGLPTDEALRQAMAGTASKAASSPPFYWAAFFLTGAPDRRLAIDE